MTTTDVTETTVTQEALSTHPALPLNGRASAQYLRAVAKMYGMETPVLDTARVLMLGCDAGADLIPFCAAWPDSAVIGIDIDAEAIGRGQALIERSGINNVQLYCLQLDEILSASPGEQDYIILQGMFSLLDNGSREGVLAWCRQHLSPNGLIAIQWPCYPGARSEETLRDAMLLHSSLASSEEEKINSARAAATWLSLGMTDDNPLRNSLQRSLAGIETQTDTALSLKYLSGINEAAYLVDFNAMVERNGLVYVGDAEPWQEVPLFHGNAVNQMHKTISPGANKIIRQQYLDFAVNRQQRFSLLMGEQHQAAVLPLPDKEQFKALNWAGNFQRLFQNNAPQNAVISPDGALVSTDHALTLRILDLMGEVWPLSLSYEQIVLHTTLPEEKNDGHASEVLKVLWSLFLKGSQSLLWSYGPCPYSASKSNKLTVIPGLAALSDPAQDVRLCYNFWHLPVELNEAQLAFLNRDDLSIEQDSLVLMNMMRRKGVLTGSTRAWQKYLQQVIALQPAASSVLEINCLMIFTHYGVEEAFRITNAVQTDPRARKKHAGMSVYEDIDERINKKLVQLMNQGDNEGANILSADLTTDNPENPHTWHRQSQVFSRQERHADALNSVVKAISLESTQWAFYYDYANDLWRLQHVWMAEKITRYCLRFNTKSVRLWALMSSLAKDNGNLSVAEFSARKALSIAPLHTTSIVNLGAVLSAQSRSEEAVQWMRKAIEASPNELVYYTNYLFALLHSNNISPEYLFAEHQRFGRAVSRWVKQQGITLPLNNSKDPERRLRVAFVSGDLGLHPVTNFIRPIWDALDREQFELYAYQSSNRYDMVTRELKESAQGWCEGQNMSSIELAKRIHQDEIDILIDLSGHTDFNCLKTFGLKPAPVSMSFIGYPGTTGMEEMDYFLMHDKMAEPGEMESQFSEALIYLPFSQQFELFHEAPDVAPTPALSNGYFTFGSFNRTSKINDAVLVAWAEVLKRCENSRMLIGGMPDDELIARYFARFAELGVDASRLIIRKRTTVLEYMSMHNEVDILLDTFPYPGGTTSNYGLQMGVPTLSFAGDRPVMRQGSANMRQFGLDEFVVTSAEEYVARAVEIAGDIEALNQVRLGLRDRISGLQQTGRPAAYFEVALREAWKRYCRGESASSFSVKDYMAG